MLRRRGPLGHISNTPLSLTRRRSNLKRLEQSAGQPRPSLSPPARTGGVVLKAGVPSNPGKAQTEALLRRAGMPHFRRKAPTRGGNLGSPSRLFHQPRRPTLTGRCVAGGGGGHPLWGLRPARQTVRHGASEILYEPVARRQMCRELPRAINASDHPSKQQENRRRCDFFIHTVSHK